VKTKESAQDFPVVCVGGSAGGLDAYVRLLRHLPADMGAAIVIVNHLRTVATRLHEILPRHTRMPVELITENLDIRPNQVFIIPEQRDLHVRLGEFRLKPISKPQGWPDVITVFLRSLTRHWDGKLIAVIVSGYDGDGAAALGGIKKVGGITIAPKPATAAQPDMPESAIDSGWVDFVLTPEEIALKIIQLAQAESRGTKDASQRRPKSIMKPSAKIIEKDFARDLQTFGQLPVKNQETEILKDRAEKTTGPESVVLDKAIREKSKPRV